jgi:hypothetical protein
MRIIFALLALIYASGSCAGLGYVSSKILDYVTSHKMTSEAAGTALWLAYLPLFLVGAVSIIAGTVFLIYEAVR